MWATNTPPHVRQVRHTPQQPTTTNDIVFTAKVTDADGVDAATLRYQVVLPGQYLPAWLPLGRTTLMNSPLTELQPNPDFTNAANWASTNMLDDGLGADEAAGDGVFTAVIAARPNNRTLVRYRVVAEDTAGRSVMLPYSDDPSLNYACFVYDGVPAYSVETSVYDTPHTYDAALMNSLPVYHIITRDSDLMHCYAYSPAYLSWQIPKGNLWARRKFNWECAFVYNGQYLGDFHGYQLALENHDARFLEAHDLEDGNVYKLRDGVTDGLLIQRVQGRLSVTNANDYDNIRNNLLPARSEAWLHDHVDYDGFYSYQAVTEAVRNYDVGYFGVNHPANKNQVWHFDISTTNAPLGQVRLLPHDTDASWYQGYQGVGGNTQFKEAIYNAGGKPAFKIDLRNRIREFRDLVWQEEVILPFIEEHAQWLEEFSQADRDRWRGAPAEAGYENNPALAGSLELMEEFAFEMDYEDAGLTVPMPGGRAAWLDGLAAAEGDGGAIPLTPTIAYAGVSNYPVNGLAFSCSSFQDPQGPGTFGAMEWRVGEITDTNAPAYDPGDPAVYEIEPVWESDELTNFTPSITIPPAATRVGHTYRARVRMQDDTGRWSHWSAPREFTVGESDHAIDLVNDLRITEVMYNPPGGESGREREFVELMNAGTNVLHLAGVQFTSGIDYVFGDRDIAPGTYILIVRDLVAFSAIYPTNGLTIAGEYGGKLGNGGERLRLKTASGGAVIADFTYGDGRGWPLAADGAGHALIPIDSVPATGDALDYGGHWRASAFIGGSPGRADPDPILDVAINEFAAHTDTGLPPPNDSDDWIELHSVSNVTLIDWYLSDDAEDLKQWRIPPDTVITAGGWLVFNESTGFHSNRVDGFGLDKAGEQVFLSYLPGTDQDRVADGLRFEGQENGASWGRYPDGAPFCFPMTPTPTASNRLAAMEPVISQIMYYPRAVGTNTSDDTEHEYIVIRNDGTNEVELWNAVGPWRVSGIGYTLPSNTVIGAGEAVMIVPFNPTNAVAVSNFLAAHNLQGTLPVLLGPHDGTLDNTGERLALERPQAPDAEGDSILWVTVDEAIYSTAAPWPDASANGAAIHRIDLRQSGNDPLNWTAKPTMKAPRLGTVMYGR